MPRASTTAQSAITCAMLACRLCAAGSKPWPPPPWGAPPPPPPPLPPPPPPPPPLVVGNGLGPQRPTRLEPAPLLQQGEGESHAGRLAAHAAVRARQERPHVERARGPPAGGPRPHC